jgi:hypothetical protein
MPSQQPETLSDNPIKEFESSFLEENGYRKVMVVSQLQKLMRQDYISSSFDDEYKS